MDAGILVKGKQNTLGTTHRFQTGLDRASEGIGIPIGKDLPGPRLLRKLFELGHGITTPDDETPADRFEIPGQRVQRSAEKFLTGGTRPVVGSLPVACDVGRNDLFPRLHRSGKGGVVGDSEITPEPMDDTFCHELWSISGGW